MKIKTTLILILFCTCFVFAGFGQCGVKASDDKAIVCGGEVKLEALSTWSNAIDNSADITGFRSVYFVNELKGFTVGAKGIMHITKDGGQTWTTYNAGLNSLRSVYFTDADTGFVVGKDTSSIGRGVILRTVNGGDTWSTEVFNDYPGLTSICFVDKNTGYAAGEGVVILKTTDHGQTWTRKIVSATDHFTTIKFPTATTGYAFGEVGVMCKTTDGGETWVNKGQPVPGVYSSFFTDVNTGYVTCKQGLVYKTTDGGSTWIQQIVGDANDTLKAVFFVNANTGYVGSNNAIWKTTDAGISWKKQDVNATINSIYFQNEKSGYATGTKTLKLTELESVTWSPSTGLNSTSISDPIASPNKTTTYKATIKTFDGCTATDSVVVFVNPLMIDAGVDQTITCGGKTQFYSPLINYTGNKKLSYLWSPANSLDSDTIMTPTSNANKTTGYHVTLTTTNGCVATDSLTIFVNPLVANAGSDKMNMCGDSILLDNVTSNYTGTAPLTYSWLPTTGLHNAGVNQPLTGAHDLTYTVTITTSNGCVASDQVRVDLKPMDAPEICMVGVDSTNKNVIRWNDLLWDAIDSVFIYRETSTAGTYVKIGSTAFSKNGFRDLTSQPEVKSNKYKISTIDTCGLESLKSISHKTMHLAITKGIGTSWNLIWEPYEGFTVPTYNIYRGTDVNNLQLIDATSGTSTQFTNYNPPPGDLYYQVEVVIPNPCDPSNVAKALRSNVAASKYIGIFEQTRNAFSFSVYPNPATDMLTIQTENNFNKNTSLIIYNSLGAVVKEAALQQNKQQIDVSDLSKGFYMIELKSAIGHAVQKLTIEK